MRGIWLGCCAAALVGATAQGASGAGFGGKFERLIAGAPVATQAALRATRELVRKSFRVLGADARLKPLRGPLYRQFQHAFGRALDAARIHRHRAGGGLLKNLRARLHRAWHLTGRFAKRKLNTPKIPAVFATVRRKTTEGFRLIERIASGKLQYREGLFNPLFPRVSPRVLSKAR